MTDTFSTPDDLGEIRQSELHASLGERLGAQALDTLDPKNSASGMWLVRRAREAAAGGLDQAPGMNGEVDVFGGQSVEQQQAVYDARRAAIPDTPIDAAKARIKEEGLEGHLNLPSQPSIKTPVLDLMVSEARERRDREMAIAQGPQGFMPDALGLVTSLGAGMIDPVQMAAFSIPGLGEASMGKLMAAAGDSILNRTGARALQGAAQGAVGTAALQPADWWLHTIDGQDYTFSDALKSVVMGAGMGAGFHAGFGAIGDVRARMRGMGGESLVHPALVMTDLPPAAQEDLVRAAIADIAADQPVRAAEILNIAADHDPRLAESLHAPALPELHEPAAPLVVARRMPDGTLRRGESGQIHADLVDPDASPLSVSDDQMGFARPGGDFMTRDDATKFLDQEHPELSSLIDGRRDGAVRQIEAGQLIKAVATEAASQPKIPDLVTAPKPRGRAAAHADTLSLNEHIASNGGLKPDPELSAIYGGDRGPFIPGFGPLIRKGGMSLDDALSSAKQHGYMSDPHDAENGTAGAGGRTSMGLTPRDLLDHLDAENRGRKLYKAGHVEKTKYDAEQEKHVIMGAIEQELEKAGAKVGDIDPKLLDRTVEIVHREGVSDVLDAYERAIMEDEERYNAIADARQTDPIARDIPGFDDGGTAPGDGAGDPLLDRQAGRPEPGRGGPDDQKPSSHGARAAAAAADPRWRELADVRPPEQDPEVLAEARAAERLPEPDSLVPERSLTAAEKAAADAEEIWRKLEPTLTESERQLVNDVLDQLKLDKAARDNIITDGVACLVGAIA